MVSVEYLKKIGVITPKIEQSIQKVEQIRKEQERKRIERRKPTVTERTIIEKRLAIARTPQEKAYLLEQLKKRQKPERRTEPEKPEEPVEPEELKEEIELVPSLPEKGENITTLQLSTILSQIYKAQAQIEQLPDDTVFQVGDREITKQEALRELEDYKEQIGILQNKLRKEGNLHLASYQDPETKEWQTVAVSNKEARELGIWTQAYQEAERLYDEIVKGNTVEMAMFALRKFIDPNDPLGIKTITTAITTGDKQKVINVIAQSKYQQYSAKREGFKGIAQYTLQMPIVQYGLAVTTGALLGAGIGAVSAVAPKLGTVARVGTKVGAGVGVAYAGAESYKSYQQEGLPGLASTATRFGIAFYGGYKGFKAGYPAGYRYGLSKRAIQYDMMIGKVRGGVKVGKREFYWKSRPLTKEDIRVAKFIFMGEPTKTYTYEPEWLSGYLPASERVSSVQSRFYDRFSISYGRDTTATGGLPYESYLKYAPEVYKPKVPVRFRMPGRLVRYGSYGLPYQPLLSYPTILESGGTKGIIESVRRKPRYFKSYRDLQKTFKPQQVSGKPVTQGQRQQTIQIQKQIQKQKKIVETTEQKLKKAEAQAQRLRTTLNKTQSMAEREKLYQAQQQEQARANALKQQLQQERATLSALIQDLARAQTPASVQVQSFSQAQAQKSEFYSPPVLTTTYILKRPKPVKTRTKFGLPLAEEEEKKKQYAYNVYINNKKQNPKPLNKQTALGMGADITDKTTATSFRIKQTKQPPTPNPMYSSTWSRIKYKFTKSKNVYKEKKQYQKDYNIEKGYYVTEKPRKRTSRPKSTFFSIIPLGGKK